VVIAAERRKSRLEKKELFSSKSLAIWIKYITFAA
jgi:hypothetical protein